MKEVMEGGGERPCKWKKPGTVDVALLVFA